LIAEKEVLRALDFLPKSFYFFWGRKGSKESRNLLKKIPQITYKAIFRSCLYFWGGSGICGM
jgi:hypothetical protein